MHGCLELRFSVDPRRAPRSTEPAVLQEAWLSLWGHLGPVIGGISCQREEVGLKFLG